MSMTFISARILGAAALLAAVPATVHAATAGTAILPVPLNPVVPAEQRQCATRTASGLGYTVLREANAARPGASDVVLVNYIGYLAATGDVFDQNARSAFAVSDVIPGFSEGLQIAPKGSVLRLCIPSSLGYGARGSGPIPADAALVFQVEVLDFKTLAEVQAMQKANQDSQKANPAAH
jgi:FKBP-type peptidyl-prolyl cis-trans isomerase FkpA